MTIFLSTQVKKRERLSDLRKLQNMDLEVNSSSELGLLWFERLLLHGRKNSDKPLNVNDLWERCGGSFRSLSTCSVEWLLNYPGITLRDVELICLSMSLAKLRLAEEVVMEPIRNSLSAMRMLESRFCGAEVELFYCLYLNRANRVIKIEQISVGGISSTVVDIRVLMRRALELRATGVLVAHNHPSGNLSPSDEDIDLTHRIKKAGDTLDIRLVDHLIVFENQYYSLADEGRI